MSINPNDTPLRAEVRDGVLTIEIGVKTLAWASSKQNGGPLDPKEVKVDGRRCNEFAKDVAREIMRENEVGDSPVTRFLDDMIEAAVNNGSVAMLWEEHKQRARRRASLRK